MGLAMAGSIVSAVDHVLAIVLPLVHRYQRSLAGRTVLRCLKPRQILFRYWPHYSSSRSHILTLSCWLAARVISYNCREDTEKLLLVGMGREARDVAILTSDYIMRLILGRKNCSAVTPAIPAYSGELLP